MLNRFSGYIALSIFVLVMAWFSACKPKQICPAYQSAFYLDKKIAEIEFSPFDKDSMPKMEELVRKTDVLLVLRLGKKKTDKRMAIIPMITIFPEQADSALAMADSMAADSAYVEEESPENSEETGDSTNLEIPEGDEINPPGAAEENQPQEKAEDDFGDVPKPAAEKPKGPKKTNLKDPELSDPSLKAEFEESFDDSPKDEDLNAPLPDFEEPPPPPVKKKKAPKKGPPKAEPDKPKEVEQEEDKF